MAELLISKIKLPDNPNTYILKDALARQILAGLDETTVIDYVQGELAKIDQFSYQVVNQLPSPSADVMYIIYLVPKASPATGYQEYLCIDKGTQADPRYVFEEIGDTDVDLSGYVQKTTTIAGVDLQDNITKSELQTALELGDLAYKDNASGTLTVVTGGSIEYNNVTSASFNGTAATITVSGDANEYLAEKTYLKVDTYGDGQYITSVVPSYSPTMNEEDITITVSGGTVTDGTAATVSASFLNQGALPSFTEGTFTQGSLPTLGTQATGTFAQSGLSATVGTGDDAETLIFSAAQTASAVTPGLYTNFDAGSLPNKAADTWDAGSLPTLDLSAFDGGSPTQVSLPTVATIDANSVVVDITGETAVDVLNNVALATDDIGSDDMVQVATDVTPTVVTATFSGTYTPAGTIQVNTTTATVNVTTTTATATVTVS